MKKLLNTLYVTSADSYLALDGENVVILEKENELGRLPLHNLEAIISFGYRGTSPALMGACAERNVSLCYVTPQGRFLARIIWKFRNDIHGWSIWNRRFPADGAITIQTAIRTSANLLSRIFLGKRFGAQHPVPRMQRLPCAGPSRNVIGCLDGNEWAVLYEQKGSGHFETYFTYTRLHM